MKLSWRQLLVVVGLEWLFVDGLVRGYAWFSRVPFSLPQRISSLGLIHLFLVITAIAVLLLGLITLRRPISWLVGPKPKRSDWHALWINLAFVFPIPLIGRLLVPSFDAWYAEGSGFLVPGILGGALVSIALAVTKEELLERLLQRTLLDSYGPLVVSVTVACQFGIAHFFREPLAYGLASVFSVIPVAFLLSFLYAKTRSLIISLSFHLLFNALVITQIILHAKGNAVGELVLWIAWGIAWLGTIRPAWRWLRAEARPKTRLRVGDWIMLLSIGLGLPLAYLFLHS